MVRLLCTLIICFIFTKPAFTEEEAGESTHNGKHLVWPVCLAYDKFLLQNKSREIKLKGNASRFAFGFGYIADDWIGLVTAQLITGPFTAASSRENALEYSGNSLSFDFFLDTQGGNIRSKEKGYGIFLGTQYADISGISIYRRAFRLNSPKLFESWGIFVSFGFFTTWMEKQRKIGTRSQNMVTRIEGYILSLGLQNPLFVKYNTKTEDNLQDISASKSGLIHGYNAELALTMLIGS